MPSVDVSTDFERFVAHVVTSPQIEAAIDYQHVMTGSGNDTGLDSVAIVVNGSLVTDPDEIEDLAATGATLDVHYIFAQAETATSFSTSKIGQITYGVKDFFADSPTLTRNDVVSQSADLSKRLIEHARLFRNGNPVCSVYYATAGRWTEDHDLSARVASAEQEIDELSLFSKVQFVGASDFSGVRWWGAGPSWAGRRRGAPGCGSSAGSGTRSRCA
jgi:hypothetical protein